MRGGVLLEQRLHAVVPGRVRADDLRRDPGHLLGGAGIEAELFAGIVSDAGVAEPEHAVPLAERVEPVADGHVDPSATARERVEDGVESTGHVGADGLVALARHGPREHRRHFGEGVEEVVIRIDRMGSGFAHGSWIPRPSDIPRWYLARAEDAVVRVDRM